MASKLSTAQFVFIGKSQLFVARRWNLADEDWQGELPDGRSGFVMVSERTGEEIALSLERVKREKGGTVAFWEFKPDDPKLTFVVRIINS